MSAVSDAFFGDVANAITIPVSVNSEAQVLVAAVAGKQIRVIAFGLVGSAATTAKFTTDASDLTGAMSFAQNGGISAFGTPLLVCPVGQNLGITASSTADGFVTYTVR